MHRAAFPFAIAGRFAENLGHHRLDLRAFGDAVTMSAVRAGNIVVLVQFGQQTGSNCLFADIQVHKAGQFAAKEALAHFFLK